MSSRLTSAIVLGLAIIASPLGASSALAAGQATAVSSATLQTTIATAAAGAARQPGYANLTTEQKLGAVTAAVAAALKQLQAANSSLTDGQITAALVLAVQNNVILPGTAVAVGTSVSPTIGTAVATNSSIVAAAGGTLTATASISGDGAPTVLISLQTTSTGATGVAEVTTTQPAPYDPCSAVVAAYCGS